MMKKPEPPNDFVKSHKMISGDLLTGSFISDIFYMSNHLHMCDRQSMVGLLTSLLVVTCCVILISEVNCQSHRLYWKQRESTTISKAEAKRKVRPDNMLTLLLLNEVDFHFPQTLLICY